MPYGFDGFFGGIGLLGLLWFAISVAFTIAIIVLIVVGIRWLVRNTAGGDHHGDGPEGRAEDTALTLLRDRFARGEIDATEFEERKRTLGG